MFEYNYHTHTARCGHAIGTDEEYVKQAIQAGFKVLGFSDHAPYRNIPRPFARMKWDDLEDYLNSIHELKVRYKDQIEIHIGLETEFYPAFLHEKQELRGKVEYLLLGQHFNDPVETVSYFGHNTDEQILEYAETIAKGLDTGLYTYLCHPDVFMSKQPSFTEACRKASHIICAKCEETNTPLELNVRGILKGKQNYAEGQMYGYPNRLFWEIAAQYDVKVVPGIDAHAPKDLMDNASKEKALKEVEDLHLSFIEEPFIK